MKLRWPTWVGVVAEDLDAQRRFYRDSLGLNEIQAGDDWVEFDLDGNLFEIIRRSGSAQYDARRFQIGFTVDDIETARQEMIERGVEPLSEIEGGPDTANRWCYFRDPEGNVFEITQWLRPRADSS
jgi:catechol 2,3-dioxygenase-like lactoylglutathione lyase family enzyme